LGLVAWHAKSGVISISVFKTLREKWQGNYCRCCQV
jgi:hypothetical protein